MTNSARAMRSLRLLFMVYAAVIVLCFITFRSWRAVLCTVLPLMLTSILCEALMVGLNIGVKVATLPVIALGVAVTTWVLSPIKFQADMGVLLGFMFVWNMVGALILVPAFAHFLLRPKVANA